jgi:membrane dipeptidase
MRDGGLDVAAFTIPTAFFGVAGLKAFHDRWPSRTWFSPWARLNHQLSRLAALADAGEIAATADPAAMRQQRGLYGFHGIEGAHALGDDVSRVRDVAGRGVVFIGPVHLSNNAYGGSSSGSDRGLTELGQSLVREMNRAGVLLDLAHASRKTFDESLALTALPPLVSHGAARAVHDTWRNLDDDQIRAVANRGGVIGVMLAPPALAASSLDEAVRHIEHIIDVGGEDAVAIGSDFDGYVTPPIAADALPALTELMLRRGFSEEQIRKVLGENALRLLESRHHYLRGQKQ